MSAREALILLPPSEGKASGGDGAPWAPGTMALDLDAERQKVLRSLNAAMRSNAATRGALLGVKGGALSQASAANRAVRSAPTLPAIERYTGVLYDALDPASLSGEARAALGRRVLIFSGLWGVVAPQDPIPDYKLKMGASLGPLGRLSTWWRASIDRALEDRLAAATRVWNLLPGEHDAAWTAPEGIEVLAVRFCDLRPDGSLSTVSHWNKLLKGALVRELVSNADLEPAALARWRHPLGYRLRPELEQRRADGVTLLTFVSDGDGGSTSAG